MQYFLILSLALWGDVDARKAVILDAEGVDGAVAMVAMWDRRQYRAGGGIAKRGWS